MKWYVLITAMLYFLAAGVSIKEEDIIAALVGLGLGIWGLAILF